MKKIIVALLIVLFITKPINAFYNLELKKDNYDDILIEEFSEDYFINYQKQNIISFEDENGLQKVTAKLLTPEYFLMRDVIRKKEEVSQELINDFKEKKPKYFDNVHFYVTVIDTNPFKVKEIDFVFSDPDKEVKIIDCEFTDTFWPGKKYKLRVAVDEIEDNITLRLINSISNRFPFLNWSFKPAE